MTSETVPQAGGAPSANGHAPGVVPDTADFKVVWLPLDELAVDHTYQRDGIDMVRLRRIIRQFRPSALGPLRVARRGPRSFAIVDGQHRFLALKAIGWTLAPCIVSHPGTVAEEAADFVDMNTERTRMRHQDLFKARLAQGDVQAMGINSAVEAEGYRVALSKTQRGPLVVTATAVLDWIAALGGADLVGQTLRVVRLGWPGQPRAIAAPPLKGVAFFLHIFRDIDVVSRLVGCMQKEPASLFESRAKALYLQVGVAPHRAFANLLWASYNTRLRTNPLDDRIALTRRSEAEPAVPA